KDWKIPMNKSDTMQVVKLLRLMFSSFPQSAVADVDDLMEAYLFAVSGFDVEDLSDAVQRITQGAIGHERRSFVPSTAELCTEVRRQKEIRRLVTASNLREIGKSNRFVAIDGGAA